MMRRPRGRGGRWTVTSPLSDLQKASGMNTGVHFTGRFFSRGCKHYCEPLKCRRNVGFYSRSSSQWFAAANLSANHLPAPFRSPDGAKRTPAWSQKPRKTTLMLRDGQFGIDAKAPLQSPQGPISLPGVVSSRAESRIEILESGNARVKAKGCRGVNVSTEPVFGNRRCNFLE
jgi:hypothetical protein